VQSPDRFVICLTDGREFALQNRGMNPHTQVPLCEQTLRRICSEYLEMPGLRLTLKQAQRLWGLDEATCVSALRFLVDARFLRRVGNDVYVRLGEGRAPLPKMVKAKIGTPPRTVWRHAS
jgi:hypothetical protein